MSNAYLVVHSLGWAILHSLWQGALVFVALRIILALFPNIPSKHKYAMAYGGLMLLFGSFVVNFYQEWSQLQLAVVKITEGTGNLTSSKTLLTTTLPQHHDQLNSVVGNIERALPILVVIYALGLLFLSARFTVNLINIKRLSNKGIETPSHYVLEMLTNLKEIQAITKKVAIYISSKVDVPATLGFFKPIILLPVASVNNLSTEELEAILIHELAHIKRNDYLLNIIQTVAETILFFSPFAWLISAQIRKEREYCCDDEVLTYTHYPIPYAKALANLETYRTQTLAMGANGSGNHLLNRIKRIIEMKKQPVNYGYLGLCLLLVAGITISAICFTPSFAQSKKVDKNVRTEKKVTKTKIVIIDSNGEKTVYNDMEDMGKNLSEALGSLKDIDVDTNQLKAGIAQAMGAIDWNKMGDNIDLAMNSVKWDEIGKSLDMAVNTVDWDAIDGQIQASLEQAMNSVKDPKEKEKIRAEIAKAKAEMQQAKAEMARELSEEKRKEIHTEMAKAKAEMQQAKAEIARELSEERRKEIYTQKTGGKEFDADKLVNKMLADGLIDKEIGYSIRKEYNELYINGQLQDNAIFKKYKPYMDADKITIKGKEDN
ncbi:MAG: hypothetical protein EOP51_00770 [Sphingobacteriales bacterium]|nr:MAG: hypothetical protein EOP51_00770 [Sphingobacteriales bacterium]